MSNKPKPKPAPKKKRPVLYLRLDDATDRAIDEYIRRQPVPPERAQFAFTAIHNLLAAHGCWPPPPAKPAS